MGLLSCRSHIYCPAKEPWYFCRSSWKLQVSRSFKYLKAKRVRSYHRPLWYHRHLCSRRMWWSWSVTARRCPRFGTWLTCRHAWWFWIWIKRYVPEINANGSEVVFSEFILGELHEYRGFADTWASDKDKFDQLVILLYHNPNLSTIIINQFLPLFYS